MSAATTNIAFDLWVGDEPTVRFTITDAQGTLDLTGTTVTFRYVPRDGGTAEVRAMTIVETGPSPAPVVSVTFGAGDLDTPDLYYWEIRVVDGASDQLTVPSPTDRKLFRVTSRAVPGA